MDKTQVGFKGIVKLQLFDKDGNAKHLFQGNRVWDFLHDTFGVDIKLPFVTGRFTFEGIGYNAVTDAGISEIMKLAGGVTASPISHMAIGTGTGGTTALTTEIVADGGERAVVTPTSETTTSTGDTVRSVNTFTFTGSYAVTEEGLLNAGASGDLIAYRTFSAVNVASGDSLQITHDIVGASA